jgi:hypothetical protein
MPPANALTHQIVNPDAERHHRARYDHASADGNPLMPSGDSYIEKFCSEISRITAEIQALIRTENDEADREREFQTQAFQERCSQAEQLTSQLHATDIGSGILRDGDAHRVQESLKLSLAYFRRD